jgi:excinuclease UvrABC helicase subunit UvrB
MFGSFYNLNRLFKEFDFLDESLLNKPHLKGKEKVESGTDENGEWERKTYVSDTGLFTYTYTTRKYNTNKKSTNEIESLKKELNECVEKQEFEKAVELRDKIKKLELNNEEIIKLKKEMDDLVKNQDFEKAILVRDKIKSLK